MIFGRHSVLKRGCSTWDPRQLPAEVFHARLNAVREQMKQRNLDALVIYGDNFSFADLCYLTNYFPKVRGGIAVVPRSVSFALTSAPLSISTSMACTLPVRAATIPDRIDRAISAGVAEPMSRPAAP